MDKATSNREQYVSKFCHHLDQDIAALTKEVKEIKSQAQVLRDEGGGGGGGGGGNRVLI